MSYNINNKEQRFSEIQNTISEVFIKHTELINAYIDHFTENIYIQKQETYNYIIKKGITTTTHVLIFMFMKSYNIDLAIDYAHKASYYYVEFINQLGDEQLNLGLRPKDATLFAYKKTIFEISDEINNCESNAEFFDNLTKIINYYNNIITYVIENNKDEDKPSFFNLTKDIVTNISTYNNYENKTTVLYIFTEYLFNKHLKYQELLQIIELFTKMLIKHNINTTEINKKLLDQNCDTNLSNNHNKFMKWIFMY